MLTIFAARTLRGGPQYHQEPAHARSDCPLMREDPRTRMTWRDWLQWLPLLTIVCTVGTAILIIGGVLNDVKTNKADILDLKNRQQQFEQRTDSKLTDIQVTTARTDATLQALRDRRGEIVP